MSESVLKKRVVYAGDVHTELMKAGWTPADAASLLRNVPDVSRSSGDFKSLHEEIAHLRERAEEAEKQRDAALKDLKCANSQRGRWELMSRTLNDRVGVLEAMIEKTTRERDAARELLGESVGLTAPHEISTCFGYPLEEVREFLEAHRRGKVHVFKFGLRSYVYRVWVHPSGNASSITKHWMETIQDLANAEMWGNAYATYKEAVAALPEGAR